MNEFAELTKRESEIAELFAWGASKKTLPPDFIFRNGRWKTIPETYTKRSGVPKSMNCPHGGFARIFIFLSICRLLNAM